MSVVELSIGFTAGYAFFLLSTHPKRFKFKLPNIKFGRISLLPCVRLKVRGRWIHIHHWTWLALALAAIINATGNWFETHVFLKGIFGGGLVQGLTYSDRFKIIDRE